MNGSSLSLVWWLDFGGGEDCRVEGSEFSTDVVTSVSDPCDGDRN